MEHKFVSARLWEDYTKLNDFTYNLKINNMTHFELFIGQVSTYMSFRQTCSSALTTEQVIDGADPRRLLRWLLGRT